jgi:adenosyl cobinamide kinase/adenosyl cobinamide phosphate guanylyltransferase
MRNQEEQSLKEAKRAGKRTAEEAERIAKEQERKKAYLAKEEAIEKAWQARKTKHAEERATEEIEQLPRNQATVFGLLPSALA